MLCFGVKYASPPPTSPPVSILRSCAATMSFAGVAERVPLSIQWAHSSWREAGRRRRWLAPLMGMKGGSPAGGARKWATRVTRSGAFSPSEQLPPRWEVSFCTGYHSAFIIITRTFYQTHTLFGFKKRHLNIVLLLQLFYFCFYE